MQMFFFASFEMMGWVLGDAFSARLALLPAWARAACAVLVIAGALISAAVITAAAALTWGIMKAAFGL